MHDESLLDKARELQNKISSELTLLKQKHKVDFVLPDSMGRDLEWTGLDLATTPGVAGASAKAVTDPGTSQSVSRPDTPFPKPSEPVAVSSTPRIQMNFEAFDKVFESKTKDSKYLSKRPDQDLYQTPATRGSIKSQVAQGETVTRGLGLPSDDIQSEASFLEEPSRSLTNGLAVRNFRKDGSMDLPKFSFNGDGWRGFIHQFEIYAKNMPWTEANKIDAFALCLKGAATDFFTYLSDEVRYNFEAIKTKFGAQFEKIATPSAARWELFHLQQREDESLEAYLTRVQKVSIRAFPDNAHRDANNEMIVEFFLKGIKDKESAMATGRKQPKNIEEACKYLKQEQNMSRALLSKRATAKSAQQFRYPSDGSDDEEPFVRVKQVNPTKKSDNKSKVQFADPVTTQPNSDGNRSPNRTQVTCYKCGELGHYARDCPRRDARPSSPKQGGNQYWQGQGYYPPQGQGGMQCYYPPYWTSYPPPPFYNPYYCPPPAAGMVSGNFNHIGYHNRSDDPNWRSKSPVSSPSRSFSSQQGGSPQRNGYQSNSPSHGGPQPVAKPSGMKPLN